MPKSIRNFLGVPCPVSFDNYYPLNLKLRLEKSDLFTWVHFARSTKLRNNKVTHP